MQQCRLPLLLAALVLIGSAASKPAQAQETAPPTVPRSVTLYDFLPGVGRWVSTLDNFEGLVGVALVQGTGKDNKGNSVDWQADVRVMQGMFIGRDDRAHRGTFALLGLDLFAGSGPSHKLAHSLHFPFHGRLADDKDPLYGPFWTGRVAMESLKGTPYTSQMSVDYTDTVFHDAFAGGAPEYTGARVTMHVDWLAGPQGNFPGFEPTPTYVMHNPAAGFTGEYTLSGAHLDFSFTSQVSATDTTPFTFTSNADGQKAVFGQVGHEMNGIFLR